LVFLQILSKDDIKKLRKLGVKLESYVDSVDETVIAFPSVIPQTKPYSKFKVNRQVDEQLTLIFNKVAELLQALSGTRILLGNEIILTADAYYAAIKRAAKSDIAMAEALTAIKDIMSKKGHAAPKVFEIAAEGTLSIENVVTGTELVNKGQAVISFKAGQGLGSKSKAPAITIDPMGSQTIPTGWTKIEITNLSSSQVAKISVRIK
jgi:hypothetical protein